MPSQVASLVQQKTGFWIWRQGISPHQIHHQTPGRMCCWSASAASDPKRPGYVGKLGKLFMMVSCGHMLNLLDVLLSGLPSTNQVTVWAKLEMCSWLAVLDGSILIFFAGRSSTSEPPLLGCQGMQRGVNQNEIVNQSLWAVNHITCSYHNHKRNLKPLIWYTIERKSDLYIISLKPDQFVRGKALVAKPVVAIWVVLRVVEFNDLFSPLRSQCCGCPLLCKALPNQQSVMLL